MMELSVLEVVEFIIIIVLCIGLVGLFYWIRKNEISRHASNKIKETFKQFDEQSKVAVIYIEDLRVIAEETYQTHQNIQHLSEKAAKYAKETGDFIQSGSNSVTETVEILEDMNQHIERVTTMSKELLNKVKTVDDMAGLVTDLAKSIKLLSLNASIEAARAGEAGLGFAVVAEQIRNLADESSEYAKNIMSNMEAIKEDSSVVADGMVILSDKRESAHESIEAITTYFQSINRDSNKIIRAVHEVNDKVEEGLLSSERIKESSGQVAEFFEGLQEEITSANEEIELQYNAEQRNLDCCNTMKQTIHNMLVFTAEFENMISDKLIKHCEHIANMLNRKRCGSDDIAAYCDDNGISEIYITNDDGVRELTNNAEAMGFRFPDDEKAQAYEFRKILKDHNQIVAQNFQKRDLDDKFFKFVAVSKKGSKGIVQAGLYVEYILHLKML